MSWYGDPDGLHRLGRQLSAAAARVRDRASDVRATSTGARWQGPAADAFHASVFREGAVLERAADELDVAAAAMHRHADAVQQQIDRLLAAERAAERLLSAGSSRLDGLVT